MKKIDIKNDVLTLLSEKDTMSLQIDTSLINDNTSLIDDVALDSIQLLELVVLIENRFS